MFKLAKQKIFACTVYTSKQYETYLDHTNALIKNISTTMKLDELTNLKDEAKWLAPTYEEYHSHKDYVMGITVSVGLILVSDLHSSDFISLTQLNVTGIM